MTVRLASAATLCLALVLGALAACSTPPPIEYPVSRAPAQLAHLRIHVRNASQARVRQAEEDATGYTVMVRGAVQRALIRAGYVVVVDPDQPHDLEAQVDTDHHSLGAVRGALATTMTLSSPAGVVDQRSGVVAIGQDADIDERGAIAMVESLARSARLRAYAAELLKREPSSSSAQQVAGGSEPRVVAGDGSDEPAGSALARSIEIRNRISPGAFEVINTSAVPVELAWQVQVEWQVDGRWTSRGVRDLHLIDRCGALQQEPCAVLAAGQVLRPVPWTGFDCASQCGPAVRREGTAPAMSCVRNATLPGTYRFVLSTCDQTTRFEGPAFELPVASAPTIFDSR